MTTIIPGRAWIAAIDCNELVTPLYYKTALLYDYSLREKLRLYVESTDAGVLNILSLTRWFPRLEKVLTNVLRICANPSGSYETKNL